MKQITDRIFMLEVKTEVMGRASSIFPVLIKDGDEVILVDTGFPGTLGLVKEEFEKVTGFRNLKTIVLTHQDVDHVGNLPAIRKELAKVKILCHKDEKPYIQGDLEPHKLKLFQARYEAAEHGMKEIFGRMVEAFKACKTPVDRVLNDGEEFSWAGGCRVVATPGHTAGHMCLYFPAIRLLVAGDLLNSENGNLTRPSTANQYDQGSYEQSLRKTSELDIRQVICYHGGLAESGLRFKDLVEKNA